MPGPKRNRRERTDEWASLYTLTLFWKRSHLDLCRWSARADGFFTRLNMAGPLITLICLLFVGGKSRLHQRREGRGLRADHAAWASAFAVDGGLIVQNPVIPSLVDAGGLRSRVEVDAQHTVNQETVSQGTGSFSEWEEEQQQQGPVVVLNSDEEIASYPLGPGDVLTETEDGDAQVVPLLTLVQQDIEATQHNYGLRISTECYYSASQFLGTGGEEWTLEEERKREYHLALRREMENLYGDIGAFSIDEGLAQYFTADLVARFRSDNPDEQQRQRRWLRYIRSEAGNNLQNPAGFLRTRLESGQWPPRGAARMRNRTS